MLNRVIRNWNLKKTIYLTLLITSPWIVAFSYVFTEFVYRCATDGTFAKSYAIYKQSAELR
jgi:hypothetical protein